MIEKIAPPLIILSNNCGRKEREREAVLNLNLPIKLEDPIYIVRIEFRIGYLLFLIYLFIIIIIRKTILIPN